jgi:hypothetical protein
MSGSVGQQPFSSIWTCGAPLRFRKAAASCSSFVGLWGEAATSVVIEETYAMVWRQQRQESFESIRAARLGVRKKCVFGFYGEILIAARSIAACLLVFGEKRKFSDLPVFDFSLLRTLKFCYGTTTVQHHHHRHAPCGYVTLPGGWKHTVDVFVPSKAKGALGKIHRSRTGRDLSNGSGSNVAAASPWSGVFFLRTLPRTDLWLAHATKTAMPPPQACIPSLPVGLVDFFKTAKATTSRCHGYSRPSHTQC